MSPLSGDVSIDVSTKGEVADAAREAAREKFSRLAGLVREPVRAIDIRLIRERDPANDGLVPRKWCSTSIADRYERTWRPHMQEAIDMAADHLHRRTRGRCKTSGIGRLGRCYALTISP